MSVVHHREYSGTVYTPNTPLRGPLNTGLFPVLYPLSYLAQSNTLNIHVKAANDAEIILYDELQDKDTIKICLGSSGNTTSTIGFFDNPIQDKKYPKKVVQTIKILSPKHFKAFNIRWNYGLIEVLNDGDEGPFLVWRGPSYLYIGGFGVRTNRSYGTWRTQGSGAQFDTADTKDDTSAFQHAKINSGKLEFEVKANTDAILALTTFPVKFHNAQVTPSAHFLIGNWSNNKTALYLNRALAAQYDKVGILSPFEFRRFWIKWDSVSIQYGEYGTDIAKMAYISPGDKPLDDMKYFGFVTSLPNVVTQGFWHIIEDEVKEDDKVEPSSTEEKPTEAKVPPALTEVKVISTNTRYGFVDMSGLLTNVPPAERVFAPDNIYHGGISLFGTTTDFIKESGINEKAEDDYFTEKPLWVDSTFYTSMTKDAWVDWVQLQKQTQFTDTNYDVFDNNCLTFVAKACKFLGGEEPTKQATQREFVKKNRNNPDFLKMMSSPPPPAAKK